MKCDEALVLIYDLADGEISPQNNILLKSHLETCSHCQTTLKSIETAESFYKKEMVFIPNETSSKTLSNKVWQNKNVFPLQPKQTTWSTKRIVYYVGAMAASFAAFIYLVGSIIVAGLISKIDLTSAMKGISTNGNQPNISIEQILQPISSILAFLATINAAANQSALINDLGIILFLASLQFTISYLFAHTKPKQDKKL